MTRLITAAAILGCLSLSARAQSSFTGRLVVSPDWLHTRTGGVSTLNERFGRFADATHTHGTNDNQMTAVVRATGTLTNGAAALVDLAAATDSFGQAVAFGRVNVLAIRATGNDLDIGDPAGATWSPFLGASNDTLRVRQGGLLLLHAPIDGGYPVTAPAALRLSCPGPSNTVYDILVGGT